MKPHPPRIELIEKIKSVQIPLHLVPKLTGNRLVTEKSGPGFLLFWNVVILERLSSKELVNLLCDLDLNIAFDFLGFELQDGQVKKNKTLNDEQ